MSIRDLIIATRVRVGKAVPTFHTSNKGRSVSVFYSHASVRNTYGFINDCKMKNEASEVLTNLTSLQLKQSN